MSAFQTAIAVAGMIGVLIVLAGLVIKRRYNVAYTFTLYLAVVFVTDLLQVMLPATFYRREFYLQKEILINALRFGVALELMFRTFRAFPTAHRMARALFLALLCVILGVVLAATAAQPDAFTLLNKVQPRVLSVTVWLFTALAALILWYRLPVHSFHKAILLGWVPYLLIFSAALNYVGDYGKEFITLTNYVHTLAYLGLLVYWARAAWATIAVHVSALPKRSIVLERKAS